MICVAAARLSFEHCIAVLNMFKVNCKSNGVTFFEVLLVFLLINFDMFVIWIWFTIAVRRKLGYYHIQMELNPLAEMLQYWIENCSVRSCWNDSCREYFSMSRATTQLLLGVLMNSTATDVILSLLLNLNKLM